MKAIGHRTAFVTGASSGIGAALARELARQGVHVAIAARREEALRALASDIEADGGRARIVPLDVRDPAAVGEAMLEADDAMDGIDLVIANAGVGEGVWSGKIDWAHCDRTLGVNVVGATATLTSLIPRMVERDRGHLVGISSVAAYRGLPKFTVYAASKAYLSTLLEGLRIDLRRTGLVVSDVRPGYVATEMTARNKKMPFVLQAEQAATRIVGAIAARRTLYAFPLPTASAVRAMSSLPNALYDRMMGR